MKADFRKKRTRAKIHGTEARPRLAVFISNTHITAQIINDDKGATIAYATTVGTKQKGTKKELAEYVGAEIGKKAKKANVKQVVFDRGSRLYAGRMSALAEAVRKEGLEF